MSAKQRKDWFNDLLAAMPATVDELAARLGSHRSTINVWLSRLREVHWVHVIEWRRAGTTFTPVYQAGQGIDAEPFWGPVPLSDEEREHVREEQFLAKRRRQVQQQIVQLLARGPATPFDALFHQPRSA